jgi:hypothetical protein
MVGKFLGRHWPETGKCQNLSGGLAGEDIENRLRFPFFASHGTDPESLSSLVNPSRRFRAPKTIAIPDLTSVIPTETINCDRFTALLLVPSWGGWGYISGFKTRRDVLVHPTFIYLVSAMSVIDTIKDVVGLDSGPATRQYRCVDCDNQFSSAKDPGRALCTECMGHNVELIDDQ